MTVKQLIDHQNWKLVNRQIFPYEIYLLLLFIRSRWVCIRLCKFVWMIALRVVIDMHKTLQWKLVLYKQLLFEYFFSLKFLSNRFSSIIEFAPRNRAAFQNLIIEKKKFRSHREKEKSFMNIHVKKKVKKHFFLTLR